MCSFSTKTTNWKKAYTFRMVFCTMDERIRLIFFETSLKIMVKPHCCFCFLVIFNCALIVQLLLHYIRKKLVFYFWNSRYAYQLTWFVCKPCRLKPDKTICRSPRKKCPASTAGAQNKSPLTVLPTMHISTWKSTGNFADFRFTKIKLQS